MMFCGSISDLFTAPTLNPAKSYSPFLYIPCRRIAGNTGKIEKIERKREEMRKNREVRREREGKWRENRDEKRNNRGKIWGKWRELRKSEFRSVNCGLTHKMLSAT